MIAGLTLTLAAAAWALISWKIGLLIVFSGLMTWAVFGWAAVIAGDEL